MSKSKQGTMIDELMRVMRVALMQQLREFKNTDLKATRAGRIQEGTQSWVGVGRVPAADDGV